MSFNRLTYDTCAYAKNIQQSTDPLDNNLFKGKYENCKQCPVGLHTNNLDLTIRAEVESDLLGQTRIGSKCPDEKFPKNKKDKQPDYTPPEVCDNINYITPTNISKATSNGLKSLDSYGQNFCPR